MKNVVVKTLFCLLPFAFAACGGDSGSNTNNPSETNSNVSPGTLVPGKCIVKMFRGFSNIECDSFSLNESDSSYTLSMTLPTGVCSGPDAEHISWIDGNVKFDYKFKYSFHGDTLYTRLVNEIVDTDNESLKDFYSVDSDVRDTFCEVDVYVSDSHQGIKGMWKYVSSYHESPNIYVNQLMNNVFSFMSIGEDSYLMEEVDNPNYSFAKSMLVEWTLMDIYNHDGYLYFVSTANVGYQSSAYPYNNPAIDIQLVSESANKVVFKVNGEDVVFSNISAEIDYFNKTIVSFDLEYAGQKCNFYDGFESVSPKTCKAENIESLELDYEYDESQGYESRTLVRVDAHFYEYGPKRNEFQYCLRKMLNGESDFE